MDLDLRGAQIPPEGRTITKGSLIDGVDLKVPPDARVVVGGFTLLGGKDVERRPAAETTGAVIRVRAWGVIGGGAGPRRRLEDAEGPGEPGPSASVSCGGAAQP